MTKISKNTIDKILDTAKIAEVIQDCIGSYGPDNRSGLYALVGWPADAIYHHYLALRTWEDAARLVGYSVRHVQSCVRVAFELADANGQMWTELGVGMAE